MAHASDPQQLAKELCSLAGLHGNFSSVFQDWLCAKLSEHHASITGVLLDSGNNFEFSLKGFCKTIYRTSELAPSEILSELVLS